MDGRGISVLIRLASNTKLGKGENRFKSKCRFKNILQQTKPGAFYSTGTKAESALMLE